MVEREDRPGVAILRMRRGRVNALDSALLGALMSALDEVESAPVGVVVLTGAGSAFSAGVDLFRILEGGPAEIRSFLPLLDAALLRLFSFPKPTVAAVNGHALAGGHLLLACCDRRLMARGGGRLGVPELQVGVPLPPVALEILRATLPPATLQDLVYTGRTFDADEGLALGAVHELVEPGDLLEEAVAQAARLAAVPPAAYQLTKRQLVAPALERAERQQAAFGAELAAVWESTASSDAIRSYLARTVKRPA